MFEHFKVHKKGNVHARLYYELVYPAIVGAGLVWLLTFLFSPGWNQLGNWPGLIMAFALLLYFFSAYLQKDQPALIAFPQNFDQWVSFVMDTAQVILMVICYWHLGLISNTHSNSFWAGILVAAIPGLIIVSGLLGKPIYTVHAIVALVCALLYGFTDDVWKWQWVVNLTSPDGASYARIVLAIVFLLTVLEYMKRVIMLDIQDDGNAG